MTENEIYMVGWAVGRYERGLSVWECVSPDCYRNEYLLFSGIFAMRDSEFDYEFDLRKRPEGLNALWYGPLLYSLPIKAAKRRLEYERGGVERKFPYCDWELRPASPWNMAFAGKKFEYCEGPMDEYPFGDRPACWIKAEMAPIDWGSKYGHANAIPRSRKPLGEARETVLVPYGCAKLRMTAMPLAEK